jgi:hypothetical protein
MPAYEACREWALHPWLPRPAGVAHLMRGGVITWVRQSQLLPVSSFVDRAGAPDSARPVAPPLLTLVAAMIAQVCQ